MDESQGLREEDEWSSSPLLSAPFLPWPIGAAQPILAQGGKSPSGLFFCFIWNPQTPGMEPVVLSKANVAFILGEPVTANSIPTFQVSRMGETLVGFG